MKWFEKIKHYECFSQKRFLKLRIIMYYLELFFSKKRFCFA